MLGVGQGLHRGAVCRQYWLRQEEFVIIEISIHSSRDLCRLGTERWAATFQKHDYYDVSHVCLGVRSKPSEARALVGAGSGLTQNLFFGEIQLQAAGGSVGDCACHPV